MNCRNTNFQNNSPFPLIIFFNLLRYILQITSFGRSNSAIWLSGLLFMLSNLLISGSWSSLIITFCTGSCNWKMVVLWWCLILKLTLPLLSRYFYSSLHCLLACTFEWMKGMLFHLASRSISSLVACHIIISCTWACRCLTMPKDNIAVTIW